jgi:hypothetical protein
MDARKASPDVFSGPIRRSQSGGNGRALGSSVERFEIQLSALPEPDDMAAVIGDRVPGLRVDEHCKSLTVESEPRDQLAEQLGRERDLIAATGCGPTGASCQRPMVTSNRRSTASRNRAAAGLVA